MDTGSPLDILLHPLAAFAALALGLGISIGLFVQVKAEMRRQAKRWAEERNSLQAVNLALRGAVEDLKREPPVAGESPLSHPLRPSINMTRRSQVLRLHHRGEMPEQIAAALGVPLNEVDLMLKVNRMVNERVATGARIRIGREVSPRSADE